MNSNFYHKTLLGTDFFHQLQKDVEGSLRLRFLVAYVSGAGLQQIGIDLLTSALKNKDSFGIASLDCAIDFKPMIQLQEAIGADAIRIKLFMDLHGKIPEEKMLSLLHSKIISILRPSSNSNLLTSVIYIGSHNWTATALNGKSMKNAEASIRIMSEITEAESNGIGVSIPAELNRHLIHAWNLKSCIPATESNEKKFHEWGVQCCGWGIGGSGTAPKLEEMIVLIATTITSGINLKTIKDQSIYLQANIEDEGKRIFGHNTLAFCILLWDDENSLKRNESPYLLLGRATASIQTDESGGDDTAEDSIEGFMFYLADKFRKKTPATLLQFDTTEVEFWTLNKLDHDGKSSNIDAGTKPPFQFQLHVDEVILPEKERQTIFKLKNDLYWNDELAFSTTNKIKFEKYDGIAVDSPKLADDIMKEQEEEFGVKKFAAITVDKHVKGSEGLRLAEAPINNLLIPPSSEKLPTVYRHRYERIREKKIFTAIDVERVISQKKSNEIIKRTQFLFQESGGNLVYWFKSLRDKDAGGRQGKIFE